MEYKILQTYVEDLERIIEFLGYTPRKCKKCKHTSQIQTYVCTYCGYDGAGDEDDEWD